MIFAKKYDWNQCPHLVPESGPVMDESSHRGHMTEDFAAVALAFRGWGQHMISEKQIHLNSYHRIQATVPKSPRDEAEDIL